MTEDFARFPQNRRSLLKSGLLCGLGLTACRPSGVGHVSDPAGTLRGDQLAALDQGFAAMLERHHIPGLAAGIILDGRLAWAKGFGFADIENRRPMTADTIQNIGSVTKTVTTTLVLQDIEVGRLDLDGDINRYLPFPVRNPNHAQVAITIRQLLTHRSSIRDGEAYGESYRCGDRARILSPETAAMALAPVHYERALGWDYVPRYFGTRDPIPGGRLIGHNGADPGIGAVAVFRPEGRSGFVMMFNAGIEDAISRDGPKLYLDTLAATA